MVCSASSSVIDSSYFSIVEQPPIIVSLSYAEIIPIEPDTVSTVGGNSSLVVLFVYVC